MAYNHKSRPLMINGIRVVLNDWAFEDTKVTLRKRTIRQRLLEGIFTRKWAPRRAYDSIVTKVPNDKIMHMQPPGEPERMVMHSATWARISAELDKLQVRKP